MLKSYQIQKKYRQFGVKNLNRIVNKMNNRKSSMIDMKQNYVIKEDVAERDKSATYSGEKALSENG